MSEELEVNYSEALKCLKVLEDHCKCDYNYCNSLYDYEEEISTIRQCILESQAQEIENSELIGGISFNKDIVYLKQSIEQCNDKPIFYVSRSYGNKYIVPEEYFNNLTNELNKYKKAFNEIKEILKDE